MKINTDVDLKKIRKLRLDKGLTQQQLAELLGYKMNTYHLIERGKRGMSVNKLLKLAKLYDCNIDDLLNKSD